MICYIFCLCISIGCTVEIKEARRISEDIKEGGMTRSSKFVISLVLVLALVSDNELLKVIDC